MRRLGWANAVLAVAFFAALAVAWLNYQDKGLQPQHWQATVGQKVLR